MKDLIAALQSLTLPWDAISGTRIVLDGVNGRILIYNAADELIASISPTLGTDADGNVVQLGMAVYNTAYDPPAYVQLERSNVWVVSGDESHYFNASASETGADMQVVDDEGTNITASISSAGVPFFRADHRINGADACHLQIDVDQDEANLEYLTTPGGAVTMWQRFLKNAGIMWLGSAVTRMMFWDKSDGYLKSGTFSGGVHTTENWTAATLNAGWAVRGSETPMYRLFADGTVKIRGSATRAAGTPPDGTVVFTLPAGYRPGHQSLFPRSYWGSNTCGRLLIATNGNVEVHGAPSSEVSLDGVEFGVI